MCSTFLIPEYIRIILTRRLRNACLESTGVSSSKKQATSFAGGTALKADSSTDLQVWP